MTSLGIERISEHLEGFVNGIRAKNNNSHVQKFPMQRLKPAVHKYQKVLEIDLDRLQKHRNNIDRFIITEEWAGLHQEQVNASGTVQQIKATLHELERTRAQVFSNELDQFDLKVHDVKVKAIEAVTSFLHIKQGDDELHHENGSTSNHMGTRESTSLPSNLSSVAQPQAKFVNRQAVPNNSRAAASWDQLKQEVEELHKIILHFAIALEQDEGQPLIDTEQMQKDESKTNPVLKASNYKMAVFPVVGALIGGAMAGPVGLYAGIKVGSLAGAVGGGVAGLAGGTILNSQSKKSTSIELKNLDQTDENSTTQQLAASEVSSPQSAPDSSPEQPCADGCEQSFIGQILSWGNPRTAPSQD